MKVKTFFSGLANGIEAAINRLDKKVLTLGDVTINQTNDVFIPNGLKSGDSCIIRTVVYTEQT